MGVLLCLSGVLSGCAVRGPTSDLSDMKCLAVERCVIERNRSARLNRDLPSAVCDNAPIQAGTFKAVDRLSRLMQVRPEAD